ncbi:hypothetical protein CDL12_27417 [Handroanthus impetiginosus]|uniref:Uncharacterized protein n=1 Tax=Handroanthus impetiginosus TaxID=429701 RepID=A0A2G9G443_9LAMI|nr:hypothetical protein CDL12_29605 [Handroanthus impetiginosus]PIN00084.1 hypothetical protein CDL12_27417 [Handroanthus impetiginosus]
MATRSYSGLLLCLVTILLAVDYSSANSPEGNIGRKRKWLVWSLQRGAFDSTDDDNGGRKFLGGRKILQGLNEESLYISGKNKPEYFQERPQTERNHLNAQNKNKLLKGNHNKNVLPKHDYHSIKKNHESKAFLEAADEVANLMGKDYRGAPRRKPPINNHEPKD